MGRWRACGPGFWEFCFRRTKKKNKKKDEVRKKELPSNVDDVDECFIFLLRFSSIRLALFLTCSLFS